MADAIDVGRFTDRQALVINARLHPADVITHDEKDVGLLLRRRGVDIFSCATAGAAVTTAAMPTARSAAKAIGALVRSSLAPEEIWIVLMFTSCDGARPPSFSLRAVAIKRLRHRQKV